MDFVSAGEHKGISINAGHFWGLQEPHSSLGRRGTYRQAHSSS